MKKVKVLLAMVLAISLCLSPLSASAASKKEIKKVQTTVKKFYNAAKVYNAPRMKSCFVNPGDLGAFETMKEMAGFCRKKNKKLKYTIRSTKVKGKSATVKVRCTYKNAYKAMYYSCGDAVMYQLFHPYCSERELHINQYKGLLDNVKYFGVPMNTKTITLNLKKVSGTWKISKVTRSILDSINCNYESAYQDYFAQYD